MHQTFTGSSRRPRQVNLSGRKPNPFASTGSSGSQQALQSAHQDRIQRQQQRTELTAARNLQRTWRGYSSRKKARDAWRLQWDQEQDDIRHQDTFDDAEQSLSVLRSLLLFYSAERESDLRRLLRYGQLQMATVAAKTNCSGGPWPMAYLRLERACLSTFSAMTRHKKSTPDIEDLSRFLTFIVEQIPQETARISSTYFCNMTKVFRRLTPPSAVFESLKTPLRTHLLGCYEGFVRHFLTEPASSFSLDRIADAIQWDLLSQAADGITRQETLDARKSLWLLANYVHLTTEAQSATSDSDLQARDHDRLQISVIARLLPVLAESIDVESRAIDMENDEYDDSVLTQRTPIKAPLNVFLRRQLVKLVDQNSIRRLLTRSDQQAKIETSKSNELAGYALSTLR